MNRLKKMSRNIISNKKMSRNEHEGIRKINEYGPNKK